MTYPNQHLRVTWIGDGWGAVEEWSTGVRLDGATLPTTAQLQALDTAFQTMFSSTYLKTSSGVRYLGVKVSPVSTEGLYGELQSAEYWRAVPHFTAWAGGIPQITVAATLTTDTRRGLANEGRMYLPATALLPDTGDGRIAALAATNLRSTVAQFIHDVNAVGLGPVTVFSRGTSAPGSPPGPKLVFPNPGAKHAVTGVRVGRVLDTQRRRRSGITEEYVTGSIPPP